jgi:lauroyl/myristoyl acyltransferase
VLELLRAGCTVSIAFDSVGSFPTPFLGRQLSLASGPARLAKMADALVLPFVTRRRGAIPALRFAPPLEPRDFEDDAALQAAISTQMETWALELPEAVWPLQEQPGGPALTRGPTLDGVGHSPVRTDPPRP